MFRFVSFIRAKNSHDSVSTKSHVRLETRNRVHRDYREIFVKFDAKNSDSISYGSMKIKKND